MKETLMMLLLTACISTASAQISKGGFPLSQKLQMEGDSLFIHNYPLPDWGQKQATKAATNERGVLGPEIVGMFTAAEISFPESGIFTYLADGQAIWKTQIRIDGAPAIGLYYDDFLLPKGVSYYISNATGSHQLGAYTSTNNGSGVFAHEPIQGAVANLEMNIPAGMNIEDIHLHINRALVYFSSVSYLNKYKDDMPPATRIPITGQPDTLALEGYSSSCQINAICPLGAGNSIQRKATVQLIIPYDSFFAQVGGCSATLINNTANTTGNCQPYILTATHCEKQNHNNPNALPFEQMLVRFNFENEDCAGSTRATVNTLSGVQLKARAAYPDPNVIMGDFMLLSLKETIPNDWDAYLSGWNRADSLPLQLNTPQHYTSFHHPAGDTKKVMASHAIDPNGYSFDPDFAGTHWETNIDSGGVETGSSGSSLLDKDGYVIGIASVAYDPKPACNTNPNGEPALFMTGAAWSKLSYAWDYDMDGPDNFRKLQPWLDPANTGVVTLDPVQSNCETTPTHIETVGKSELANALLVYPNPSSTGHFTINMNFKTYRDLQIEIIDISGTRVAGYTFKRLKQENISLNLGHLPGGIYMARFRSQFESVSKKIIILK
ncbi:MAG: T9SS type A sorting domain-containing protein [Sphingobacteriales bacterium]|nr:MAG: T9SS type A sorting domain-containing protein [Sphingobacteriales bacterium]